MPNNLKKLRVLRKMTQAELSRLSGVNRSLIGELEVNMQVMSWKTAEKLAKALDTTAAAVMGDDALLVGHSADRTLSDLLRAVVIELEFADVLKYSTAPRIVSSRDKVLEDIVDDLVALGEDDLGKVAKLTRDLRMAALAREGR